MDEGKRQPPPVDPPDISEPGRIPAMLEFLDAVRATNEINMFLAAAPLALAYGLDDNEAELILLYWMDSYGERHPD